MPTYRLRIKHKDKVGPEFPYPAETAEDAARNAVADGDFEPWETVSVEVRGPRGTMFYRIETCPPYTPVEIDSF